MKRRSIRNLAGCSDGAVAPTVALSLIATPAFAQGLFDRPANPACAVSARPESDGLRISVQPLFPGLSLSQPLAIAQSPSDPNVWWVAERIGDVSQVFGESVVGVTLPKLSDLLDDLSRNSRALDRAINQFQENPQSVVFGRSVAAPGPGEPGFVPPAGRR